MIAFTKQDPGLEPKVQADAPAADDRRRLDDDVILKAAASIGLLGGAAQGAAGVIAALCAPDTSAADVAALISRQPGLTAKVLRVANSAFYGRPRTVATIERAVVVLGLDAVRGVAAAACLDRALPRARGDAAVEVDGLLRHSVAVAAAAEMLAKIRHRALAGDAFMAGLLHDFGMLVQLRLEEEGVRAMFAAIRSDPSQDVRQLEGQSLSVGHAHCGAVILEAWRLPAPLVAAASYHHTAADAPAAYRELASLIALGDVVARRCGVGIASETAEEPFPEAVLGIVGLRAEDLDAVARELPARTAALQRAFGPA